MTEAAGKKKLIDFLDQKAFRPVLRARPEDYPENKRDAVRDVQRRTETEIERFHSYGSAHDVVVNFRRDLTSEPAKKVHTELKSLGLPTIVDIRDEFEQLAQKVGAA
jgi:hypothetical protein